MNDLGGRLRDAGSALSGLREPLVAGEPWPLSETWGTEPEASWGPREVLGHVNEMLPYWVEQLGFVLAADPADGPVAFGRIASDQSRLDRIAADRAKTVDVLLDEIASGIDRAAGFIEGLTRADLERTGLHPSRGEIAIGAGLEVFLVGHIADHNQQLRAVLGPSA